MPLLKPWTQSELTPGAFYSYPWFKQRPELRIQIVLFCNLVTRYLICNPLA